MSVTMEATEIERHAAHLSDSELDGEPPFTIHGIAIGEGDVTRGSSGIKKKWPREALQPAAETLAGRPIVVDHENSSHSVVGKVTEAIYKEDTGVLYEAELHDEELAEKIANGLLEVSIRGFHEDVSEMEESDEGAKVVSKLRFDNLSIVPMGAAPSNTVEIGPSEDLSPAECAEMIGELDGGPTEGSEEIRKTDTDRYSEDIERYPEGDNTPPEDSEGMHEYEEARHSPHLLSFHASGEVSEEMVDEVISDLASADGVNAHAASIDREPVLVVTIDKDSVSDDLNIDNHLTDALADTPFAVFDPEEFDWVSRVNQDVYLEEGDTMAQDEELAQHAVHEVSFDDTREAPWNKPSLEDFTDDSWDELSQEEKSDIASNFLVSKSGFPPENFGDLALPVVDSEGNLVLNALQNAKARAGQVEGISEEDQNRVENMIDNLANDNFEDANFDGEESEEEMQHAIDVVRSTRTSFEFADGRIVSVDDDGVEELRARTTSNDDAEEVEDAEAEAGEGSEPDTTTSDNETTHGELNMAEDDENMVTIDEDELASLRAQAEQAEEREEELAELREGFSEDLTELKERTAVLEEVDRDQVQKLADSDEPMVVESEKWDELEASADEARSAYAAALSEYTGPAVSEEDLAERYSISELRERLEEQLDEDEEVEEELTPDPKSEDPETEEELEEASGEADETEELDEEVEGKQEELRSKILG